MIEIISLFVEDNFNFIFYVIPAAFGIIFYIAHAHESPSFKFRAAVLPIFLTGGPLAFWNFVTCHKYYKLPKIELNTLVGSAMAWAAGAAIAFVVARAINSQYQKFRQKTTLKTGLARSGKTDVRTIDQVLPEVANPFNPIRFWSKTEGVFLGVGADGKPVRASYPLRHMQVTGTSGCGKGVLLSQIALEMAARGEAVFFIDPKNDEWAPSVCSKSENAHFIDLNLDKPQFNMFEGASHQEIYELFLAGFSLGEKGAESDFYRIKDRQAAKMAAAIAADEGLTAATLQLKIDAELGDAPAFQGYLREMADVTAINADVGLSLADVVNRGGLVYVVGSMRRTEVIRMQRMLLVRLIQLAESRDRSAGAPRQICVVLDELKYHISRPAIEALGAARDKGMHVVLAYQSLSDLRDCPADLNGDAVVGAVFENTPIKISYKVEDVGVAQMLAQKSGKVQVDDETRQVEVGAGRVEKIADQRSIRQAETYLVDPNMLHNLKPRQAIVFGAGRLPQFISTSPVSVGKVKRMPVEGQIKVNGAADLLNIKPLESK